MTRMAKLTVEHVIPKQTDFGGVISPSLEIDLTIACGSGEECQKSIYIRREGKKIDFYALIDHGLDQSFEKDFPIFK